MNTKDSIRKAYDLCADDYAGAFWNEFDKKHFDRCIMLPWFAGQFGPDDRVLEIGAGPGEVSAFLSQRGVQCTATDLSPQMIENAKKYFSGGDFPNIRFEVQDFTRLTYPDESFAGVIGYYAIVNLTMDEIQTALAEVKRVLKPGGLLLFTFHIFEGNEKDDVANFFNKEGGTLTFYYHKVDEMKALVETLGYQVIDILVRRPYPGAEFQSQRAYFLVRK